MSVRVYIAAAAREVDRVRAAQRALADRGWELTHDWLSPMLANIARGLRDTDLDANVQLHHATEDLSAIRRADVLWLLAPVEPTKGAWYEAGFADASGTPYVVSGGCPSIFLRRAHSIVPRDEDAIAAIERIVLARGGVV